MNSTRDYSSNAVRNTGINAVPLAIRAAAARQQVLDSEGKGTKVLAFNQGTSRFTPKQEWKQAMAASALEDTSYLYPPQEGLVSLREAATNFYREVFQLPAGFDPNTECTPILGSKTALSQIVRAFNYRTDEEGNFRDTVAFFTPGYSSYEANATLNEAEQLMIPMNEANQYKPRLNEHITPEQAKKISMLIVNYPNNPTGAVADLEYFQHLVDFAKEHGILIVSDNPYAFTLLDESLKPLSIFHAKGAKDCAIELFSGSKCFDLGGARMGVAVGNASAIATLKKVRSNEDAGPFAVPAAGFEAALRDPEIATYMKDRSRIYTERARLFEQGLVDALGYPLTTPAKGGLYLWVKAPEQYSQGGLTAAEGFADALLNEANISAIPGTAYGEDPESISHVRFTLNQPSEIIQQALKNMQKAGISWDK